MENQIELLRFEGLPALLELAVLNEEHSDKLDFNESFWVGSVATAHINAAHAFRVAIELRDLAKIARFQEVSDSLLFAIIVKVKGEDHRYSLIVVETCGPSQQLVAKLDGVQATVVERVLSDSAPDAAKKLMPQIR